MRLICVSIAILLSTAQAASAADYETCITTISRAADLGGYSEPELKSALRSCVRQDPEGAAKWQARLSRLDPLCRQYARGNPDDPEFKLLALMAGRAATGKGFAPDSPAEMEFCEDPKSEAEWNAPQKRQICINPQTGEVHA